MVSFTTLLFLVGSLGIATTATLAYLASGYRPEVRFVLVASLLLSAALFAFSPLLFLAHAPELRAACENKAKAGAEAQQREESGLPTQSAR
jgi:hypothetical protein